MKIYDISQGIFSCDVYPGDPSPEKEVLSSIENGDLYRLTAFRMCAHNGTHIDSPSHFIPDGKTVDQIPPEKMIGPCLVIEHNGNLTKQDAVNILQKASSDAGKRILFKGDTVVSLDGAMVFAHAGIDLLGNESQTIGPADAPMDVHKTLLGAEVVLLEGIRLADVPEGEYFLSAAPLLLEEADGAPCRAVLIRFDETE